MSTSWLEIFRGKKVELDYVEFAKVLDNLLVGSRLIEFTIMNPFMEDDDKYEAIIPNFKLLNENVSKLVDLYTKGAEEYEKENL